MEKIPIDQIEKADNVRDDSVDVEDLKASISVHGLLQPVIVKKVLSGYQLVAGHRRYNACKSLGWKEIPAIVHIVENMTAIQLTENLQRVNMNLTEESESIHLLKEQMKVTPGRLARILGKSSNWVNRRLSMYDVRHHLIEAGIIPTRLINSMTMDVAWTVSRYDRKYWIEMCSYLIGRKWMPDTVKEYCERVANPDYVPEQKIKSDGKAHVLKIDKEEREGFSIMKDDYECTLKLLFAGKTMYQKVLASLEDAGGEVI